jgi:hypothetical protein
MRLQGWIALLLLLLLIPSRAYAYLDPGVGSIILQIILGGLAGLAVLGRIFWKKLRAFFPSRSQKSPETRP